MPANRHEVTTVDIRDSEVTLSTNTTDEFSAIVDIQVPAGYRWEFPGDKPIQFFAYTHESKSVSANSTETVNLSNDLVNSPAVRDVETGSAETSVTGQRSLVVWDDNDDIQTGVDSVNYSGNSFDYTNSDGSQDNLEVFYLWADTSQLEFRTYTPDEERFEKKWIGTMRQFHESQVYKRQSHITFDEPFTMLEKEHLKMHVKTPVDLTNWDVLGPSPSSSPGNFDTYSYSDLQIPVKKIPMKS